MPEAETGAHIDVSRGRESDSRNSIQVPTFHQPGSYSGSFHRNPGGTLYSISPPARSLDSDLPGFTNIRRRAAFPIFCKCNAASVKVGFPTSRTCDVPEASATSVYALCTCCVRPVYALCDEFPSKRWSSLERCGARCTRRAYAAVAAALRAGRRSLAASIQRSPRKDRMNSTTTTRPMI